MAINIIESIEYTYLHMVELYYPYPIGKVKVISNGWKLFPMHPASGQLDVRGKLSGPGSSYTSTISLRLKEDIILPPVMLLKVTLCGGKKLIVGTPDIPVMANKNISLELASLNITYEDMHQPLELL